MNKHQKKGGEPQHVRLYHWMLNSAAWKDLNAIERAIYELKIWKSTAHRALRSLQAHGFIVVEKLGAFHLKMRHASEYRLTAHDSNVTEFPKNLATKEFMRWPEIQNTVPPAVPTGTVAEPNGYRSGTVSSKNMSDGYSSGTVKANSLQ